MSGSLFWDTVYLQGHEIEPHYNYLNVLAPGEYSMTFVKQIGDARLTNCMVTIVITVVAVSIT